MNNNMSIGIGSNYNSYYTKVLNNSRCNTDKTIVRGALPPQISISYSQYSNFKNGIE